MKVIGLRTKNKDICNETVHDAGFRRFSMVNTGRNVPAAVALLWEWIQDDLEHPKSVRGQGNLNLVALPNVPDELNEKAELVLDYDHFKENAKSIDGDLLRKKMHQRSKDFAERHNLLYLSSEEVENIRPALLDGVLIDSREVPEERTRKKGSQDKADPEFDLQEGDLCSYRYVGIGSSSVFPVVVERRTSRNVWVEPVQFGADEFEGSDSVVHPNEKKSLGQGPAWSFSADEDEIEIVRDKSGSPVRRNSSMWSIEDFPKRFYINKDGEWEEYGEQRQPAKLIESIRAKDAKTVV
jgi:hypothetical protein